MEFLLAAYAILFQIDNYYQEKGYAINERNVEVLTYNYNVNEQITKRKNKYRASYTVVLYLL